MPVYNASEYLELSVRSVIEQTYKNWELLIVDDFSTDDSLAIAKRLSALDARIQVFSLQKNSGAAVSRNLAIEKASGRYIAFLDSDDTWKEIKLERQLAFMNSNDIAFSYSGFDKIDSVGNTILTVSVSAKISYSSLLKSTSIGCLTAIYDAEALGKVYMPLIRKRQDLGLWLKLLKLERYAYGLNESLACYRVREGSISENKFNAALYTWKLYREVEKLGALSAIYYFIHYAINGILKTKLPKLGKIMGRL